MGKRNVHVSTSLAMVRAECNIRCKTPLQGCGEELFLMDALLAKRCRYLPHRPSSQLCE